MATGERLLDEFLAVPSTSRELRTRSVRSGCPAEGLVYGALDGGRAQRLRIVTIELQYIKHNLIAKDI